MTIETLKRPWTLRLALPFYRLIRRLRPRMRAIKGDPLIRCHASAMLARGNWLYRLVFPRFFSKIRYDLPLEIDLKEYARDGILVYIGAEIGNIEYAYFSHLFKKLKLPLAAYANGLSLCGWMTWHDFRATLACRLETMNTYGGLPHPASSGKLCESLAAGASVLFSMISSELREESLVLSESHQLILAAIRAQHRTQSSIYLVPLNFMWDRRPRPSNLSTIDHIFGAKDSPGPLRKAVLMWRHHKNRALVQVGNPIDLKAYRLERPQASDEELATHVRKRIMEEIRIERRAITGPPIRPQRWFVERVMSDPRLDERISQIASERHKPHEHVATLARRYAGEIAANINYRVINFAARFMIWIFRNLFEGISLDTLTFARIKELSSYTPLIFAPNHRSHVDYLLLSYLFYANNMIVPHIAAGINLSFWPLGSFYRRCGAFFIRRTFGGNLLYKAVMQTYLNVLLNEGYHQEFFIEGGRTRTGKLRPPRLGMMSMYTEAVAQNVLDDLIFVPVSVTYDRVIEHRGYLEELEGAAKKPEQARDMMGLARFLRKQKERNGLIYVRFGLPVSVGGIEHELGFDRPITPEKKTVIVRVLADRICREINRKTVITPLALAALALLVKPRRAVPLVELMQRIRIYLRYIAPKDIETSEAIRHDPTAATKGALDHLVAMRMIRFHDDPEFPFYEVIEDRRLALDFYKNTIVHYYASIAFLSTVLRTFLSQGRPCKTEDIVRALDFLEALFQFEFRFNQTLPIEERLKPPFEFLKEHGVVSFAEDDTIRFGEGALEMLDQFAGLVGNVIDAYKAALIVLKRNAAERAEEKYLVRLMLEAGPKLFLMGFISRREAITKENFSNAILALCELGAISKAVRTVAGKDAEVLTIYRNEIQRLQEQLETII